MVVWLIGLSAAGKTSVGRALVRRWREQDAATVLVDGDDVRHLFDSLALRADHTLIGRERNARRTIALCEFLDGQGLNVVCCQLALFEDLRVAHRSRVSGYMEVYLKAPLSVVEARDPRGLYRAARQGTERNVVGIDLPFPEPQRPDLVLDSTGARGGPDDLAAEILQSAGALL